MNAPELKMILELHGKWLRKEDGGARADLTYANLTDANLRGADLTDADLRDANLTYANLTDADLRRADLRGANLTDANLIGADLARADLRGVDPKIAKTEEIRGDLFKVLSVAKEEVVFLYDSLIHGKVNGTAYKGECACLVGTIANARHESYKTMSIDLRPEAWRPAERWFLGIAKGDTPETNPISALTKTWIEEWAKENGVEIPNDPAP
jgi:hypothetical protein